MPKFDLRMTTTATVKHEHAQEVTLNKLKAEMTTARGGIAQPEDVSYAGACNGMSTMWVMNSALGRDYWRLLDTKEGRAEVLHLGHKEKETFLALAAVAATVPNPLMLQDPTAVQKLRGELMGQGPQAKVDKNALNEHLKMLSLFNKIPPMAQKLLAEKDQWMPNLIQQNTHLKCDRSAKFDDVTKMLSDLEKVRGFVLIRIEMKESGHAMAAQVTNDGIQFMDPNFGEIHFTDRGEFSGWFCMQHLTNYKNVAKFELDEFRSPPSPRRPEHRDEAPESLVFSDAESSADPLPLNPDEVEVAALGPLPATPTTT